MSARPVPPRPPAPRAPVRTRSGTSSVGAGARARATDEQPERAQAERAQPAPAPAAPTQAAPASPAPALAGPARVAARAAVSGARSTARAASRAGVRAGTRARERAAAAADGSGRRARAWADARRRDPAGAPARARSSWRRALVEGLPPSRRPAATAAALGRGAVLQWRRSLQLRVVTTTVVLGMVVVALVGGYLNTRIGAGLFEERRAGALAEAARGARDAQQRFDTATATDSQSLDLLVIDLLVALRGVGPEPDREVVLLRQGDAEGPAVIPNRATDPTLESLIPRDLRDQVVRSDRQQSPRWPCRTAAAQWCRDWRWARS